MKLKLCLIIGLITCAGMATAETKIERLGISGDWVAYQVDESGSKICYMAARPTSSKGKYTRRGDVFLTVTHRPADKAYDVVSFVAGYIYLKGEKPTITIDKQKSISMFSKSEGAWVEKSETDRMLVSQMRKGGQAVIKGRSFRKTRTTDTFSLKGFSKAYQMINKACGRD